MKYVLPLLLLVAFCNCFSLEMAAQGSPKVSVQGTLKTSIGTAVDNGTYTLKFRLYSVATGGSILWEETDDVNIVGGVYSHLLGSVNPLDPANFGGTLFLGVTPGAGAELSPRTEMTYAPYALSVAGIANNGGSASFDANGNLKTNNGLAVNTGAENPNGVDLAIGDGDSGIDQFGDGKLAIRTQDITRMTFLDNGKVGIGALNDAAYTLSIGDADTGIDQFGDGKLAIKTNGATSMSFLGGGQVGVGNFTNPTIRLAIGDNDTGIDQFGDGELGIITNGNERMRIKPNGRIGIGTNNPQAALHVTGSPTTISSSNANFFHSVFSNGAGTNDGSNFLSVVGYFNGDLVADQSIVSATSINWSDARTKKVLGLSDAQKDLALLNRIRITDYRMIDQRADNKDYKKVIAQEVAEVFPQAVMTSRRIIPNVYEQASTFQFANGMLTVTTGKAHDFAVGNEIDLITPEGRLSNIKVASVKDAHTFTVAAEKAPSNVFVYGKYVDDFKSVDYDALSMLNISATQEMYRQIQQLQQENAALRNENGALRTQSASIESRLSKVEAMLNGEPSIGKR